jgi:hypothetical protein
MTGKRRSTVECSGSHRNCPQMAGATGYVRAEPYQGDKRYVRRGGFSPTSPTAALAIRRLIELGFTTEQKRMSKVERINYADGNLDDAAISDVELFRMERIADGLFWITLYRAGEKEIVFSLTAVENNIVGKQEKDTEWKEPNKKR